MIDIITKLVIAYLIISIIMISLKMEKENE